MKEVSIVIQILSIHVYEAIQSCPFSSLFIQEHSVYMYFFCNRPTCTFITQVPIGYCCGNSFFYEYFNNFQDLSVVLQWFVSAVFVLIVPNPSPCGLLSDTQCYHNYNFTPSTNIYIKTFYCLPCQVLYIVCIVVFTMYYKVNAISRADKKIVFLMQTTIQLWLSKSQISKFLFDTQLIF